MKPQNVADRPNCVQLPTEILLMIVELPIPKDSKPILRASDPITKWLLAFTRVCKTTYPTASQLLWRYCLCIDSKQRALDFMQFLANPLYYPRRDPWKVRGPARLYLAPFPQKVEPEPGTPAIEPQEQRIYGFNRSGPMDPDNEDDNSEVSDSSDSSSGSPFVFEYPPSPLNDLETARTTHGILATLAPVLKTLIVNMPLRTLVPSCDDQGIRRILRRGFEALVNLEEFVSVRDELFLDTTQLHEDIVWGTYWPRLRRLSLYNQNVDEELWGTMCHLHDLELVILAKPDPKDYQEPEWDIKRHWFEHLQDSERKSPDLSLVFVNCAGHHPDLRSYAASWKQLDPKNRLQIRYFTVQAPLVEAYDGDMSTWPLSPTDLCQHWITEKALGGTLWDDAQNKHEVWLRDPGP